MAKRRSLIIGGRRIRAGETQDLRLKAGETYTGERIALPLRVVRARRPGPVVFVLASIHGDEVNGTGIIREFLFGEEFQLRRGAIIAAPVVNVFGFEHHSRYMPDRRDLNRCFPGAPEGSVASRFAHLLMHEIVRHCDLALDLHSAAVRRTNYPNVRADLRNPAVRTLAEAFGCELIVDNRGPVGSFRRTASDAGCPTIVLEAGEAAKMEPTVIEAGVRGVRNVLVSLGLVDGPVEQPAYQTKIRKTRWIRAQLAGLLRFHVAPGDFVERGQPIATNESIFGVARSIVIAPVDGIVLGMTTHPAVQPGEPICHLALPGRPLKALRKVLDRVSEESPEARLRRDLASSIVVSPSPSD